VAIQLDKKEVQKSIRLSKDILYFPGHANITVLNLGTKSLMIDCGRNITEAGHIRREAESIFKNKIEYVILTHLHSDHTHSLPLYSDCQIIASKQLTKYLKAAKRKPIKNFPLVYPNVVFNEEYTLKESDFEILVKQTGGHTPDSSFIYSPKHKLLAVGDNLRSDFLWGGRQSDPDKWILALEEYICFDLTSIIIGHGEIFTKQEVIEILAYVIEVKKVIGDLLEESKNDEEIIQRVKDVKPRGEFGVFIHDDTIIKWYKFWKKKKNKRKKV
jgi:glyoxylase-like metal-dependent hydrolase (beta-lactamase superfamily II)